MKSRPTTLHDHAALHLADEEGLALLITPDDLARSRRPALGGAGLTKKVLLCPSRPTILHDHAARHLATTPPCKLEMCVFVVLELKTRGMSDLRSLTSYPSLTNCKKAA